ncbi:hypothetical protein Asi02nite_42410 [Asanoa siamensis]|uniref:Protein kinase domain-containing protein n=1 Tax=Asanoa siamensis TaxID=926357 RepID=A0ABQ4CUM6_9ACTN|nr:hypothetical protein Asi02nite_42410 [Asanoa siamensis]
MAAPDPQQREGGQAHVHKVVRRDAKGEGRYYALKLLKNTKNAARNVRFQREITIMGRLSANGLAVPPVIAHDMTAVRPFFVTPWYANGTLEEMIKNQSFFGDPASGLRILVSIAEALHGIHSHGYAHRDLKPSNLLLDDNNRVLVADFGLVLSAEDVADRLTETAEAIGSRLYIAPENESGVNVEVDQRPADFYAFAKVAYAVLTGRSPRAGMTQLDAGYRIEQLADPALLPLSGLQFDLLNPDPRARLQDWQIVIADLRAVIGRIEGTEVLDVGASDLVEVVKRAARDYGASTEALAHNRNREIEANRREFCNEFRGALSRGFHAWGTAVSEIAQPLGGALEVHCSNGGKNLREVMTLPEMGVWPEIKKIPQASEPSGEFGFGYSDGSNALFVITRNPPEGNESLQLGAYALFSNEDQLWLLRVPVLQIVRSGRLLVSIPADLLSRYGKVDGPYRLRSAASLGAAEQFGDATARAGLEILTEVLQGTRDHLKPA